jgi:hypothetical protein
MDKKQREQLLKLAKKDPAFKAKIIDIIKDASRGDDDAAAFAAWCKMVNPLGLSQARVHEILEDSGIPVAPPVPKDQQVKKARTPLVKGNIVQVTSDASKCYNRNSDVCRQIENSGKMKLYYKICRIEPGTELRDDPIFYIRSIDGSSGSIVYGKELKLYGAIAQRSQAKQNRLVKAAEETGDPRKLEAALTVLKEMKMHGSATLGMTKKYHSEKQWAESNLVGAVPLRSGVEMVCVYERGGETPTPDYRKSHIRDTNTSQVRETLMRGEFSDLIDSLDSYNSIYYEGDVKSAQHGKSGAQTLYFSLKDLGRGYTTMNPSVGKLLWVGKKSDMPRNWKQDLRERLKAVVEEHLRTRL